MRAPVRKQHFLSLFSFSIGFVPSTFYVKERFSLQFRIAMFVISFGCTATLHRTRNIARNCKMLSWWHKQTQRKCFSDFHKYVLVEEWYESFLLSDGKRKHVDPSLSYLLWILGTFFECFRFYICISCI